MNPQLSQSPSEEDIYLTDSRLKEFYKEACSHSYAQSQLYQSDNELQTLISSTLHLDCEQSLSEQTYRFYSNMLHEKEVQIKKIKEIYNRKKKKIHLLGDSLTKVSSQIDSQRQDLRLLKHKKQECIQTRIRQRNVRLSTQQSKSKLYHKYCQLQLKYDEMVAQIEQYKLVQEQLNEINNQNEVMIKQIQGLQNRRQEKSTCNNKNKNKKQSIKAEIKKMHAKLKHLQKQDANIKHQFQTNRQLLARLQKEQEFVNNKNSQMESLYNKIESLKDQIKDKKWYKQQKENECTTLSRQESVLRKQIAIQSQYKENRIKIKQGLTDNVKHNFKIIDSEADEEHNKYSRKLQQRQHNQSQQEFDQLISRFQYIKSKSKNKIGE